MVETAVDKNALQRYTVEVVRKNASQAEAHIGEHTIAMSIQRGGSAAPNAAETLLSALGACVLTNVQTLAKKMRLDVREARVEITGTRRNVPPGLVEIHAALFLESDAPENKLRLLYQKAFAWGTVTNTLLNGVSVHRSLHIVP